MVFKISFTPDGSTIPSASRLAEGKAQGCPESEDGRALRRWGSAAAAASPEGPGRALPSAPRDPSPQPGGACAVFSPAIPPLSPAIPSLSPQIRSFSPAIPSLSPAIPSLSPAIPPLSPAIPPLSPQIPPLSPQIPSRSRTGCGHPPRLGVCPEPPAPLDHRHSFDSKWKGQI
ncbi:unnamed protein product [Coccothraustes coccothraustes]